MPSITRRTLLASGAGALLACSGASGPPPVYRDRLKRTDESFHGFPRSWVSYSPTRPSADRAPLAICIHGSGQHPSDMFEKNHWARTLESAGWFGVFPQTDEGAPEDQESGDSAFLAHVLESALASHPIDPARVYCLGFSGGGLRTYKLAATHSGVLAAIAAGSAPIAHTNEPQYFPATTHPKPLSILHCHGLQDTTVPFAGGDTSRGHPVFPARDGLGLWVAEYGAEKQSGTDLPQGVPPRCTTEWWKASTGHEIRLVVDPRLDHRWPGAEEGDWYNRVILDFFERVPRRT